MPADSAGSPRQPPAPTTVTVGIRRLPQPSRSIPWISLQQSRKGAELSHHVLAARCYPIYTKQKRKTRNKGLSHEALAARCFPIRAESC
jgi:hypothetical protein